jgi:predicted permease
MDLRYAARQLLRRPGLSAVLLLTLGVGIGANATIYSWTRAILLDPLPGAGEPERVVAVESVTPSGEWVPVSYPDFRDLSERSKRLQSMTVAYSMGLAVGEEPAIRVPGELVSGEYFDVLRVQPELGRFFSEAERDHAQNRHAVVVISHALWADRFQSDPAAIGRTLRINRCPFTVIGVTPAAFHGSMPGLELRLWVPATMFSQLNSAGTWMLEDRKTRMFRVLGRLAPAARIPQARAELQSIASALAEAYPDTSKGMSANVLPVWQAHNGLHDSLREPLGMLSGVALVVLLIVCANMASLLLARATDRRRELSLRHALGAARPRLVRQLLTEAAFLAVAGAALGLLVAISLSGTLRFLVPMTTMTLVTPRADWGVLAFTVALAVAVTLLAGIAPALAGAREDANDSLKEGGRSGSASAGRQRLRATLVAAEMALALTAIVAAGLFLKSFRQLARVEPGFDPEKVALGQFSMAASGFDAAQADAFCRRLRERLEEQPSVVAVSYADYVPLSIGAGSWEDLQVEGYLPGPSENMKIYRSIVAPGYFELMKIPLLAGRDFDLNDDSAHAPAMIVNQEFVRRFFGGQYAIGRKVHGWGRWFQVVGVVRDSKVYRLGDRPKAYFYIPLRQVYRPEFALTFYVRTSGSTDEAVASLRRLAGESRAAPPLFNTRTLSESIGASLFRDRTAEPARGDRVSARRDRPLRRDGLLGRAAHRRDRHPRGSRRSAGRRGAARAAAGRACARGRAGGRPAGRRAAGARRGRDAVLRAPGRSVRLRGGRRLRGADRAGGDDRPRRARLARRPDPRAPMRVGDAQSGGAPGSNSLTTMSVMSSCCFAPSAKASAAAITRSITPAAGRPSQPPIAAISRSSPHSSSSLFMHSLMPSVKPTSRSPASSEIAASRNAAPWSSPTTGPPSASRSGSLAPARNSIGALCPAFTYASRRVVGSYWP